MVIACPKTAPSIKHVSGDHHSRAFLTFLNDDDPPPRDEKKQDDEEKKKKLNNGGHKFHDYNVEVDVKALGTFIKNKVSEECQHFLFFLSEHHKDGNEEEEDKQHEEQSNDNNNDTQEGIILPKISEDTIKQCERIARDILHASWEKMNNEIQIVHNKENERKNHIRYHYDDKLNMCRVSYKLQNSHGLKALQLRKMEEEAEMQCAYESQIDELTSKLHYTNDVIRVQENTVTQSQVKALQIEKELKQTQHAYDEYKRAMSEKYAKLECDWNRIKKQEVWAHFKIVALKSKIRKHDRSLATKKAQHRSFLKEIHDLTERLRVSTEIRTGLEKAFEKRARIRGRLDLVNHQEMIRYNRTPLQKCRKVEIGQCKKEHITRSCQTQKDAVEMGD